MECEICGKTIEKTTTILIDGTQFDVCENCVSLGKKVELPEESFSERKQRTERRQFSQQAFTAGASLEPDSLTEEFGKKIMQARQRKGLKLKDLAMKIYEKESVVQRIEAEKFTPSGKVIRKLEKELDIKLVE